MQLNAPAIPTPQAAMQVQPTVQVRTMQPAAPVIAPRAIEAGENGTKGNAANATGKGGNAKSNSPARGQYIDVSV